MAPFFVRITAIYCDGRTLYEAEIPAAQAASPLLTGHCRSDILHCMSTNRTGAMIVGRRVVCLFAALASALLHGAALTPGHAAGLVPNRNGNDFVLPAADDRSAADLETFGEALGNADAPVTVIAYVSLRCCADFWRTSLPELKRRYIDTGKIRLVFLPADELSAAVVLIAECTGPDQYFEMIENLFARQREWAVSRARPSLMRITGLTESALDACLAGPQGLAYFEQREAILAELGKLPQVPSFIINGSILSGGTSIAEMEKQLAPYLKN